MTFFTDENISQYAAKMVALLDRRNEVRAHVDHFEQGVPDTEWIATVSRWDPKPAVVCGDGRVLKNPAEKTALRTADLSFVCLAKGWTNERWETFAWKFVKVWPAIVDAVSAVRRPTIFEVSVNLKVSSLRATADL